MTATKDKIKASVFLAIESYNAFQANDLQLQKNTNTILFSRTGFTPEGKLDSLGLVNLLVLVEENIKAQCNADFMLDISEIIENKENLLINLESLINYLETKV